MKKSNKPLALDSYFTRQKKRNTLNKKESIYAGMIVSYISVVLFVAIDFACLNSSWTSVQNDNEWLVKLISVGCAVALDVPMAIAAIIAKEGYQKLRGKREAFVIVTLCIACFLIVWGFQIGFRMVTRDATFSENASTLVNTLSSTAETETTESGQTVLYAALFSGVLPFCTSLASFIITYFGCDPLGIKIYRLDSVIIQDDANIIELEQALAEADDIIQHMKFLIAYENDSLNAHITKIKSQGELLKQVVRNEIMKKLKNPEQVAIIQESGKKLIDGNGEISAPEEAKTFLLCGETEETL